MALRDRPRLLARFDGLLDVTSRYTVLREQQARDFTLGWPLLRRCLHRLGEHLTATCVLADPGQIFFLTRDELATSLTDRPTSHAQTATQRRAVWAGNAAWSHP